MSILMIMGGTPPHFYMARAVAASGRAQGDHRGDAGWRRPIAPAKAPPRTLALFERHFAARVAAEARVFDAESGGGDFRPQHLHAIYDVYENRVVDRYLDGEFPGREPRTVRQF
jgi:hypothetical protein